MSHKADIKPITYLKNHTAELVRNVSEDGRPVTITQNGEAKVVVMGAQTYARWKEAMALLKAISLSEADVGAGRTASQMAAFARAKAAIQASKDG